MGIKLGRGWLAIAGVRDRRAAAISIDQQEADLALSRACGTTQGRGLQGRLCHIPMIFRRMPIFRRS